MIPNQTAPGTADIWWLGQGSFVFEGPASGPLVVDPYLSDSVGEQGGPKRLSAVPIAPAELRVAAILLTHDHLDHTDPDSLVPLCAANPDATILAPPESVAHLERIGITGPRVRTMIRGEAVTLPGVTLLPVHALHTDDSVGLIFRFTDGPTIYHTADTEYYDGIGLEAARLGTDLLSICINGRWGNMGIPDAVRVTETVQPVEVLPMHWGLFAENTADPGLFVATLKAAGIPSRPIVLPPDGTGRHTVTAVAAGRAG